MRKALTRVADRFPVIAGPPRVMTQAPTGDRDIRNVIDYARCSCECVVLELPPTLDECFFDTLSNASQVVILFEQKIPSVRNLQLILDVLPPAVVEGRCQLVINRYAPRLVGFTADDMRRVLKTSEIQTISHDAAMDAAVNRGQPLRLQDASSQALADIDRLNTVLIGEAADSNADPVPVGAFKKLMRGLRLA